MHGSREGDRPITPTWHELVKKRQGRVEVHDKLVVTDSGRPSRQHEARRCRQGNRLWQGCRRRLTVLAGHALAVLLLLVTVLAGGAGEARAANLIKNTFDEGYDSGFPTFPVEFTGANDIGDYPWRVAQSFETGSNAQGYTLSSIRAYLYMDNLPEDPAGRLPPDCDVVTCIPSGTPRMSIYTAADDSFGNPNPDASLYTMVTPMITFSTQYGDYINYRTFTAPANATLEPNTTYFVVFEDIRNPIQSSTATARGYYDVGGAEDHSATGSTGWDMHNGRHLIRHPSTDWQEPDSRAATLFLEINGTVDTMPVDNTSPMLETATVTGTSLVLTYDEPLKPITLSAALALLKAAYTVKVNSSPVTVSTVAVSGQTVTLTLASAVTAGQTVTVTYVKPADSPIEDSTGNDADALTDEPVTNTINAPPVFADATATRTLTETVGNAVVQTAANIGAVVTATDANDDTLAYSLEGTDAAKFTIVSASGQIQTSVGEAYDREAKASYAVTVKADDGEGGTDTIAVTIDLTNVVEKPLAPAAPMVKATSGSSTSLDVTWKAPSNTGRPQITSYDVYYKLPGSSFATIDPPNVMGTSTSITRGLMADTEYEVRVVATNSDGDSPQSSPGTGRTSEPPNNAPEFSSTTATRSFAETVGSATVTTAANIGTAVTATDDDDDTLTYSLEGTDRTRFTIVSTSGQLQTKVGQRYDREVKSSYAVTVKVVDGEGGSDTIAVTLTVTNETEAPLAPAPPAVTATTGIATSIDVTWTAPSNTGRPQITSYDLQYKKTADPNYANGPQNQTGTSASITGLDANSEYQVQVRASNADGDSDWSPAGSTRTTNTAPAFPGTSTTRSFAETIGDTTVSTAADIGAVVTATDGDNDTLTYSLEGTDAGKFTIISTSGQIQTKVGEAYDREAKASYAVTVKAVDGHEGSDTIAVTLNLTDVTEKPLAPAPPAVTATTGIATSIDVTWTAPSNTGRPQITSYDLQYKKTTDSNYANGPQNRTGTSASITGLDANSEYQVQVRASNADGDSDWSTAGDGETANTPPAFATDTTTRSFSESLYEMRLGVPVRLDPVTATDDDGDVLTYSMEEGPDSDLFAHNTLTGELWTRSGIYNYEAKAEYTVTVRAVDGNGGTDTIEVTFIVLNVVEFESASVTEAGTHVDITFDSQLSATLPEPDAFTVTVDGETPAFSESNPISLRGSNAVTLSMKNRIRTGQIVTVSYTDPTAENDPIAVQDTDGNDAASLVYEPVTNNSIQEPQEPSPVRDLSAIDDDLSRTRLHWDAPVDNGGRVITGYKIESCPDFHNRSNPEDCQVILSQTVLNPDVIWSVLVETTGNTNTAYVVETLFGQTFSYRVRAINSVGASEASNVETLTVRTGNGKPSAPQYLTARANGKNQIDLSWLEPGYTGVNNNPLTGYKIEVASDQSGTTWADLDANVSPTVTTYMHTSLDPSTTRYYRVSASNSVGTGKTSRRARATTTPEDTPTEPKNLRARPGNRQVTLTWDLPDSDNGSPIQEYQWRLGYYDPETDTTSFEDEVRPVLLTLDNRTSFRWTIPSGLVQNGQSYVFEVWAINVNGAGAAAVTLPVVPRVPPPRDTPPVVARPLVDQQARVGAPFTYVVPEDAFTDADDDPLTYVATTDNDGALPEWLTFDAATRTFTGIPGSSDSGMVTVTVTASDGSAHVSDEFVLTVRPNATPVVARALVDQQARVGAPFTYVVPEDAFTDADDDPLTYVATTDNDGALPEWLTFDAATRTFTGIPGSSDSGMVTVTVTASDGSAHVSDEFVLTVRPNATPVVARALVDQQARVGAPFTYVVPEDAFTDADDDPLTYVATTDNDGALPEWLTFDAATRTFTGIPGSSDSGMVTVTVTASDGSAHVSDEFVLTVRPNATPVVARALVDQQARVGAPFTYVVPEDAFTDADDDPLTYVATTDNDGALPEWLTFDAATRTFTGTPDADDSGTVLVTVTASDGTAAVSDEFALRVHITSPLVLQNWLARFGRTVGTHVTDAVGERLRGAGGSHVTVGGYRLPLGQREPGTDEPEAAGEPGSALLQGLAGMLGLGPTQAGASGPGPGWDAGGPGRNPRLGQGQTSRLNLDLRRILMGSSFQLTLGATDDPESARPRLTAWGRVAGMQFTGREGDVAEEGDVLTGTVGVDGAWDRWLAGLAVSHSRGDGAYSLTGTGTSDRGDLENSLTSIHPYLRYAVNDRLDVWGLLGYGWGAVTLEQETGRTLETDTNLAMGAFGGRGLLLTATENGGLELATRTEAMFTHMTSDAVSGLASSDAAAHRLRVVLEGSRSFRDAGQSLTPSLEVGLRRDWGDAETGFGLELGGRIQYADPAAGFMVEGVIRGLVAHEDDHYGEWGASGTLRIDPGPAGQGLSLTLAPTWGAAASGVQDLWSRQTTAGLAPQDRTQAPGGRLDMQLGYGLWVPTLEGLVTPFTGVAITDAGDSRSRAGLVFDRPGTWGGTLRLELAGERVATTGSQPEQTIGFQLQLQFGQGSRGLSTEGVRRTSRGTGKVDRARRRPPVALSRGRLPSGVAPVRSSFVPDHEVSASDPDAPTPQPASLATTSRAEVGDRQNVVQLGEFPDPADAIRARTDLAVELSGILRHRTHRLAVAASEEDGLSHLVLAHAFATRHAADFLCAAIKARGTDCDVTRAWEVSGRDPGGPQGAKARGGE